MIYWNVNNVYGWAISQDLPVDGFKWRRDKLTFDEDFIQHYDVDSEEGYILGVDIT